VVLGEAYAGCWNAMAGRPIAGLPPRPTRPAWRICFAAAGSCSPTPTAGRPGPRMRCAASCCAPWRCATPTTWARWTLPRSRPRLTPSARSSTSWWRGRPARYPPNRRLLNHLAVERAHLYTFLRLPGVEATNWRAEQAIRPAVVTRKSWGGNCSWAGAEVWQVLASVLRTARGRDVHRFSSASKPWPSSEARLVSGGRRPAARGSSRARRESLVFRRGTPAP
jgi:hypothetical protein